MENNDNEYDLKSQLDSFEQKLTTFEQDFVTNYTSNDDYISKDIECSYEFYKDKYLDSLISRLESYRQRQSKFKKIAIGTGIVAASAFIASTAIDNQTADTALRALGAGFAGASLGEFLTYLNYKSMIKKQEEQIEEFSK